MGLDSIWQTYPWRPGPPRRTIAPKHKRRGLAAPASPARRGGRLRIHPPQRHAQPAERAVQRGRPLRLGRGLARKVAVRRLRPHVVVVRVRGQLLVVAVVDEVVREQRPAHGPQHDGQHHGPPAGGHVRQRRHRTPCCCSRGEHASSGG